MFINRNCEDEPSYCSCPPPGSCNLDGCGDYVDADCESTVEGGWNVDGQFVCYNGCIIRAEFYNDDWCDCSDCEDEDYCTCGSAGYECPDACSYSQGECTSDSNSRQSDGDDRSVDRSVDRSTSSKSNDKGKNTNSNTNTVIYVCAGVGACLVVSLLIAVIVVMMKKRKEQSQLQMELSKDEFEQELTTPYTKLES